MASSKITRKTLTPGGSSTKKSGTSVDKKSVLGLGYGPVSSKTLANKVSSGVVKAGASVAKGAGKAVIGASKAVGNLTNKAAPKVGKHYKKATSPLGAGATTPSTAAKTSSKISRKYY